MLLGKIKGDKQSSFRRMHKGNRKTGAVDKDLSDIERLKEELLKGSEQRA